MVIITQVEIAFQFLPTGRVNSATDAYSMAELNRVLLNRFEAWLTVSGSPLFNLFNHTFGAVLSASVWVIQEIRAAWMLRQTFKLENSFNVGLFGWKEVFIINIYVSRKLKKLCFRIVGNIIFHFTPLRYGFQYDV